MVGIIHYNMGNVTSVKHALDFLGIPAVIVTAPSALKTASHIVLPGVGAFAEGMRNLNLLGFVDAVRDAALGERKPFLGICLGMQLLATSGHEGGETPGLNFISGTVLRLPDSNLRVPHVGWNTVHVVRDNSLVSEDADFYFVHSYYFNTTEPAAVAGVCDYGITFPAIVQTGNIFGTQFHPEKSHQAGLLILKNFVQC